MTDPQPSQPAAAEPPSRGPRRLMSPLLIVGLVIVLAAGAAGAVLALRARAAVPAAPRAAPGGGAGVLPVGVVQVVRAAVVRSETYDGEFIADQQVELHPQVAGFVTSMLVDEGDHVRAGQILATLEIPGLEEDIARAQAQRTRDQDLVAKTRAAYEQDRITSTRLQGVAGQQAGLVAQQDIDEAKARELGSQAAWQAATSAVAVAQAELDRLLVFQRDCRIAAPFAGVVTRRYADPGALVQGGVAAGAQAAPLITLAKTDVLRLSFPVTEAVVPLIRTGLPLAIRIGALKEERAGAVARFRRRLEDATRTMEVQIDVANADGRIAPGMYAAITMETERHEGALTLPHEAVKRRGQSVLVYLVGGDHRVVERAITIGLESPERLEVLSGLAAGDSVVFGNLDRVKPGQLVSPKAVAAGAPGAER